MLERIDHRGSEIHFADKPRSGRTVFAVWAMVALFAVITLAVLIFGVTSENPALVMGCAMLPALLSFVCFRAAWRQDSVTAMIDCERRILRIDRYVHGSVASSRKVPFDQIRSVFHEAGSVDEAVNGQTADLVLKLRGEKYPLRILCDVDLAVQAEALLLNALGKEQPLEVEGLASFGRRVKWEVGARRG